MRKEDPKTVARSIAAGITVGIVAMALLHPAIVRERAERDEITRQWIEEQRAADLAYQAEVEAEQRRWQEIEMAENETTVIIEEITAEPFNDEYIPDEVEEAARKWGEVYEIAPEFLEAIAWTESRFDETATNGGCIGLMQISPRWHRDRMERLGVDDDGLYTVDGSMALAADYLHELFTTYNDPYWVLMTYNGDSNADAYKALEHSPSEYALNICDLAFYITSAHEEGGSATWLDE